MRVLKFLGKAIVVIFALIGLFVVLGIFAITVAWRSLPGVATTPQPATAVLTLDLADGITESTPDNPLALAALNKSLTMLEAIRGIEAAAKDPRVKALLLHVGSGDLDLAHAQELGDAVADFRKSGKYVLAFAESFGEGGSGGSHYLLASSASEIWLQPSGELQLVGAAIETPFLHSLLEKIGVTARMDRREEYKGALDSLQADSMPAPLRENMQALVDSWVAQMSDIIARNRQLSPAQVRSLIDRGPYGAQAAKDAKLVDGLHYWDEAVQAAKDKAGSGAKTYSLADYVGTMPALPEGSPRIAVIYGVGDVVLGKGEGNPLLGKTNIGSTTLAETIHKAVDDDKIAGIILRIDSPGGSYVAADAIWREVKRAKDKGKPLVVSMAGMAASGGYFIAAPASAIVAEPGTITGSIGVFGGKFLVKDLMDKIGVAVDSVSAGTNATIDSTSQDYTPAQWALVEADLDRVYSDFLDKVGQGRGMSKDAVRAVAKGQIWSGTAAKQNGLVDKLGGLMTAVEVLRPLAKIGPDEAVRIEPYPNPSERIQAVIAKLLGVESTSVLSPSMLRLLKIAGPLLNAIDIATNPAADERLRAPLP